MEASTSSLSGACRPGADIRNGLISWQPPDLAQPSLQPQPRLTQTSAWLNPTVATLWHYKTQLETHKYFDRMSIVIQSASQLWFSDHNLSSGSSTGPTLYWPMFPATKVEKKPLLISSSTGDFSGGASHQISSRVLSLTKIGTPAFCTFHRTTIIVRLKTGNMTNHLVQCQHVKLSKRGPQIYVELTFLLLCSTSDIISQMWLVWGFG